MLRNNLFSGYGHCIIRSRLSVLGQLINSFRAGIAIRLKTSGRSVQTAAYGLYQHQERE